MWLYLTRCWCRVYHLSTSANKLLGLMNQWTCKPDFILSSWRFLKVFEYQCLSCVSIRDSYLKTKIQLERSSRVDGYAKRNVAQSCNDCISGHVFRGCKARRRSCTCNWCVLLETWASPCLPAAFCLSSSNTSGIAEISFIEQYKTKPIL